ncbi:MAG: FtsW/RodA/SpoVE family cell cycle protein [Micropruina sp.]
MSEVVVYRKRRGIELIMLLFAIGLGASGYLLTGLNLYAELPPNWIWGVGIFTGLGLLAHGVIRWRLPYADPLLLPMIMLLNGLGLAMIHRLDQGTDPIMNSASLQLTWTGIAVVAFCAVVILLRDHRRLQRFTYLLFLIGMGILMMPLLPIIGVEKNGARIWIEVFSYNFQPAEVAKLVLSIAFASYLVEKREVLALAGARIAGIDLPRPRDLGPILIMWLASLAVLVFQKDLGTSLLFFGLFVMMLYVATERPSWPIIGSIMFVGGATLGYFAFSHVKVRVNAWLDPFSNYDQNFQVIQGQFGLAWGGLFGTGWGLGRPNLTPLAKNDFIAAAIGEELGVAGLMAVILVYGVIVARGLRTSLVAQEPFGKLLAAGLSFVFAIQVFAIIGGVTRLLPLTGLTTPFMSQGGSSLIANWVLAGVLIVITHRVRQPAVQVSGEPVQSLALDATQVISTPSSSGRDFPPPRPAPAGEQSAGLDEATQVTPTPATPPTSAPTPTPDADEATQVVSVPAGSGFDPPADDETRAQGRIG